MNDSSILPAALGAIARQLPVILVCLAGCVAVLVRWSSLRGAALPALAGFGLGLALAVVSPVVWVMIPRIHQGQPPAELGKLFAVVGVVFSLGWAAAFALLLLATLGGRSRSPSPLPG